MVILATQECSISRSEVTRKIDLRPEGCPDCHSKIFEESIVSTGVHQVIDVPDMLPDVNKYQAHTLKCAHCGKQVHSTPKYSFGSNLQAFTTTQMVENCLPIRKACDLVGCFKIKISSESVCNLRKRAASLLKNTAEKIQEHALQKRKIHADETSWRVAGKGVFYKTVA